MNIDMTAYVVNMVAIVLIGFLGGRIYGFKAANVAFVKSLRKIHEDASAHLGSLDKEDADYPKTSEYVRGQVDMAGFLLQTSSNGNRPVKAEKVVQ